MCICSDRLPVQDCEMHYMNAWLKRCVFNLDLNRESVSEPRTLSGRLFHSLGASSRYWRFYCMERENRDTSHTQINDTQIKCVNCVHNSPECRLYQWSTESEELHHNLFTPRCISGRHHHLSRIRYPFIWLLLILYTDNCLPLFCFCL